MKVSSGLALPFCDNRKPKRVQADLSLLLTVDEYNTLGFTITRLFYLNTARANKYQALCVCNVQTNLRVYKKKKKYWTIRCLRSVRKELLLHSSRTLDSIFFSFFLFFSNFPFHFFFLFEYFVFISL